MKNITYLFVVAALIAVASPHTAQAGWFDDDHHVEAIEKTKITMIEAIEKVSKEQGGIVINAELNNWGEEGAYYEIDIVKDDEEHEMLVNAVTGEVTLEEDGWFK